MLMNRKTRAFVCLTKREEDEDHVMEEEDDDTIKQHQEQQQQQQQPHETTIFNVSWLVCFFNIRESEKECESGWAALIHSHLSSAGRAAASAAAKADKQREQTLR